MADVITLKQLARQLQESNESHAATIRELRDANTAAFVKQDATIAKQGETIAKQGETIVQLRGDMDEVLHVISASHSSMEYSEWFHKIPSEFFDMSVYNVIRIYCETGGHRQVYAVLHNAVDKYIVDPGYNSQIYWLLHHALKHCAIRNRSSHLNAPVTPEEKELHQLHEKAKKRFPNLALVDHLAEIEKRGPELLTAASMKNAANLKKEAKVSNNTRKKNNDLKVQAQITAAWFEHSAQISGIDEIAEIRSVFAKGVPTAFLAIRNQ